VAFQLGQRAQIRAHSRRTKSGGRLAVEIQLGAVPIRIDAARGRTSPMKLMRAIGMKSFTRVSTSLAVAVLIHRHLLFAAKATVKLNR